MIGIGSSVESAPSHQRTCAALGLTESVRQLKDIAARDLLTQLGSLRSNALGCALQRRDVRSIPRAVRSQAQESLSLEASVPVWPRTLSELSR